MMSHDQAASVLNMNVETVRRLLASGEITASATDADQVGDCSVEAFRSAERERVRNNRGGTNGWVTGNAIFGRCTSVEG